MKDQPREDLHLSADSGRNTDYETLEPAPASSRKRAAVRRLVDKRSGGETRARKLLLAEK